MIHVHPSLPNSTHIYIYIHIHIYIYIYYMCVCVVLYVYIHTAIIYKCTDKCRMFQHAETQDSSPPVARGSIILS